MARPEPECFTFTRLDPWQ